MRIYLLTQDENTSDKAFHSCVVVAKNAAAAREVHPFGDWDRVEVWCYNPEDVTATYIGNARKDLEKAGYSENVNNVICSEYS